MPDTQLAEAAHPWTPPGEWGGYSLAEYVEAERATARAEAAAEARREAFAEAARMAHEAWLHDLAREFQRMAAADAATPEPECGSCGVMLLAGETALCDLCAAAADELGVATPQGGESDG